MRGWTSPYCAHLAASCHLAVTVVCFLFLVQWELAPDNAVQVTVLLGSALLLAIDVPIQVILSSGLACKSVDSEDDLENVTASSPMPYAIAEKEDLNCCICLENLVPGDDAQKLPCDHIFHTRCIAEWLQGSRFCPFRCAGVVMRPIPKKQASTGKCQTLEFSFVLPGQVDGQQ